VKSVILIILLALVCKSCKNNFIQLNQFYDYSQGIEEAKKQDKPILLYFTAYGTMAYDEFKRDLINSEQIRSTLNNYFITIFLYVDDRAELTEIEIQNFDKLQLQETFKKKLLTAKTKGQMNSIIQLAMVDKFFQPMYLILNTKKEILIEPFGYTRRNKEYFLNKLAAGLRRFKKENGR